MAEEELPKMSTIVRWVCILIVLGLALDWVFAGQNFFLYKFWAPKQEAARRETLEQSKSYRQGNIQRLATLCNQVANTDDDHEGLIYDTIQHEFAEWDLKDVPGYLQPCLLQARK